MKIYTLLAIAPPLAMAAGTATARETPECRIAVVSAVTDDMGRSWQAGEIAPATFVRREGGNTFYCEDHGQCLPQRLHGVTVTRPIDCRVGSRTSPGYFWLDPNPKVMGAAGARQLLARRRAEVRLSALGFDNASAGGLAEDYARNPTSSNGRLVARALAGSQTAIAQLKAAQ
jgi:hypothetical protein